MGFQIIWTSVLCIVIIAHFRCFVNVFEMNGLEMIRLSFFVKFLSNVAPCSPAYGILQNIPNKFSLSWSYLFRSSFCLDCSYLITFALMQRGYSFLKCGLKHGIAVRPSYLEMMVITENILDQVERNNLCENLTEKDSVKTALSAFTYFYVAIFDRQCLDTNKAKVLKQLWQDYVILKPDKENGIVLTNKN